VAVAVRPTQGKEHLGGRWTEHGTGVAAGPVQAGAGRRGDRRCGLRDFGVPAHARPPGPFSRRRVNEICRRRSLRASRSAATWASGRRSLLGMTVSDAGTSAVPLVLAVCSSSLEGLLHALQRWTRRTFLDHPKIDAFSRTEFDEACGQRGLVVGDWRVERFFGDSVFGVAVRQDRSSPTGGRRRSLIRADRSWGAAPVTAPGPAHQWNRLHGTVPLKYMWRPRSTLRQEPADHG
jgi:hypothetical protein